MRHERLVEIGLGIKRHTRFCQKFFFKPKLANQNPKFHSTDLPQMDSNTAKASSTPVFGRNPIWSWDCSWSKQCLKRMYKRRAKNFYDIFKIAMALQLFGNDLSPFFGNIVKIVCCHVGSQRPVSSMLLYSSNRINSSDPNFRVWTFLLQVHLRLHISVLQLPHHPLQFQHCKFRNVQTAFVIHWI